LSKWTPFGLGVVKPKHFRDMGGILWKNRDNLGYAYKVLTKGVCDGCALGVAGLHDWTIAGPHLCMTRLNLLRLNTMPAMDPVRLARVADLARLSNAQLREMGRLAYPMLRRKGEPGFTRISWDAAVARVAEKIRASTPKRLAFFLTARGVTNEVYYVGQKAARFLGTSNVDNAARLCHAASTSAMKEVTGVAASTCAYQDWIESDLLVFFGSNPANDQPVSTKYLHLAKKAGAKVVLVNPYLEPGMKSYWVPSSAESAVFGTDIADWWFPVAQGGDIAFLHGTLKLLVERGAVDDKFIQNHTVGFAELRAFLDGLAWSDLEKSAGLPREAFEQFATLLAGANKGVLIWSMGITQHEHGADGVRAVCNLGLARGWVGREGCGLVPIRGHSSVQGSSEMGAYSTTLPGGKTLDAANAAALAEQYGFPIPYERGLTSTEMLEACARGDLDVFYCLGGNFLRTMPDPENVRRALSTVPFRVHQDILVNDQMLIEPEGEVLLLPAQTRYEQNGGGFETSTERRVMFSPEIPRQVGEARPEWRILRDIAVACKPGSAHLFGCETGQAIREEIARIVPFYEGIPHFQKTGDAFQYGGRHLCEGGVFPLPDGRGRFTTPAVPVRRGEGFHVSTRRGKQFNTLIYSETDPLNGAPRDAVLMSEEDAARLGLENGARVVLSAGPARYEGRIFLAPIAPGNLQVHWPEGNVLVQHGRADRDSGVPDYNAMVCVERVR
jgi:molybdopterin-dependent oxidoreductase alpha subunit